MRGELPPLKKYWLLQLALMLQILPLSLLSFLPPPFFGYGALLIVAFTIYVVFFVLNRISCSRCGRSIGGSFRTLGHPGRRCRQCGFDLWTGQSVQEDHRSTS